MLGASTVANVVELMHSAKKHCQASRTHNVSSISAYNVQLIPSCPGRDLLNAYFCLPRRARWPGVPGRRGLRPILNHHTPPLLGLAGRQGGPEKQLYYTVKKARVGASALLTLAPHSSVVSVVNVEHFNSVEPLTLVSSNLLTSRLNLYERAHTSYCI